MTDRFDVVVVGSGPSGVHAAAEALEHGRTVALVHVGFTNDSAAADIPESSFTDLRSGDERQSRYFLGEDNLAHSQSSRAGAHLTPPREYMIKESERIFPAEVGEVFAPLLATGRGGLGVSWGSNCFTFNPEELRRAGLNSVELRPFYEKVAREIGVSGASNDDVRAEFFEVDPVQPPLSVDTNCSMLRARYDRLETRDQFRLGQSVVAVLSEDLGRRRANALHDMDFYSNAGESVWRPEVALDQLKQNPNFHEISGVVAKRFVESTDEVLVTGQMLDGRTVEWRADSLFICCGALNSARLVIDSLGLHARPFQLLCNQNLWIASLNVGMLGRSAADPRYSLSQLTAGLFGESRRVPLIAHFYSYRSLMFFRLLPRIPLPGKLAVWFLRLVVNSLTLVNVHFDDDFDVSSTALTVAADGRMTFSGRERAAPRALERRLKRFLLKLRCVPLAVDRPAPGASLHYAGSLAGPNVPAEARVTADGRLGTHRRVYIADSSSWTYLPAKGLTLTIMAHARAIVARALRRP